MSSTTPAAPAGTDTRGLFAMAFVAGVFSGSLEGFIHLGLQRVHILDNSWYPIVWIAAAVNTLILLGVVAGALPVLRPLGPARRHRVIVFLVLLAGIIPWLVLGLKQWIATYALGILAVGLASALWRAESRSSFALARYRRLVPLAAATFVTAALAIEGGGWLKERILQSRLPEAKPDAPNVLLVVIDALRADHVGAYGYQRSTTPAIDQLAAGGVVFEAATSTSSYTLPSHASMLTGKLVHEHRVEWDTSHSHLHDGRLNLPEVLSQAGYRTGAFSGNTFYFSREHGFGRGFLHFEDYFHDAADMFWRSAYGGILATLVRPRIGFEDLPGRKRATHTNTAVQSWVSRGPDRPFFVMVNYMDVHDPYLPPEPYATRFSKNRPEGLLNFKLHEPEQLSDAELQGEIDAYDGGLAYTDAHLQELVSSLRAASTRDLIVVVTSDHGEEFGEHGGYLHGRHLYFEALHVPLIVFAPGRVPAGRRVATPVSIASIPATVASILGLSGSSFSQPSLAPLWSESAPVEWATPLAELKRRDWAPERDPVYAGSVRSGILGDWHIVQVEGQPPQIFNWARDRREMQDAASSTQANELIQRVLALFR